MRQELQYRPIDEKYPLTWRAMHAERGPEWVSKWEPINVKKLEEIISCVPGLDVPLDKLREDPVKFAMVESVVDAFVSCFGTRFEKPGVLWDLRRARFGENGPILSSFTANHFDAPGVFFPLGRGGGRLGGGAIAKNMLAIEDRTNGKSTLNEISPIRLGEEGGVFVASFITPNKNVWQWEFVPDKAEDYYLEPLDGSGLVRVGNVLLHCKFSGFGITDIGESCDEGCVQCNVLRGSGRASEQHRDRMKRVLQIMRNRQKSSEVVDFGTPSSGSNSGPDGGYFAAFGRTMEEIDKLGVGRARLQLEMVLPRDRDSWPKIIENIGFYVDKRWKISLAINLEVLQDEYRSVLLRGYHKGSTTVADHIEFAKMLREAVGEKVSINSLVMFGMKPLEISDEEYLISQLKAIQQLADKGICVDLNPVKNGTRKNSQGPVFLEVFPPVDPIQYWIQEIANVVIQIKAQKERRYIPSERGCVGGGKNCSLCNAEKTIRRFVNIAGRNGVLIPELLKPFLEKIGVRYQQYFEGLF